MARIFSNGANCYLRKMILHQAELVGGFISINSIFVVDEFTKAFV